MNFDNQTPRISVRCELLKDAPLQLLDLVPSSTDLLTWIGPNRSIVGWGEALCLEFTGHRAIRDAARQWDQIAGDAIVENLTGLDWADLVPIALGSFGFADHTPGFLIVPATAIVRIADITVVVTASVDGAPLHGAEALRGTVSPIQKPAGLWTNPGRMTQNQWQDAVRRLITLLKSGAASKVVLTRDILLSAALPIDQRYLTRRLQDLYPTTWIYAVRGLIGATPEMLASMKDGQVVSRVLAGTSAPAEGASLLASMKNRNEHHFAVESVARALAPLSEDLQVPSEPQLLELPNVTHLATEVRARVNSGNVLDTIDALHPTAAVCGTPTKLAFDILLEIEGTRRGRYTGPVGWIDSSGSGEFGIALRCGQLADDQQSIRVFAGGGIMPDSNPAVELAETRAKMKPVLEALGVDS